MATKHKRHKGEIGCEASSGGRRITLDPIRELTLAVPAREVESTLPCGFRIEWAEGETKRNGKSLKFALTTGAGCGSPWACFDFKDKQYCFHVEDLINAFITAIEAEVPK